MTKRILIAFSFLLIAGIFYFLGYLSSPDAFYKKTVDYYQHIIPIYHTESQKYCELINRYQKYAQFFDDPSLQFEIRKCDEPNKFYPVRNIQLPTPQEYGLEYLP